MSELVGFDSFILSCDRIVEKLDGKQLAAAVKMARSSCRNLFNLQPR